MAAERRKRSPEQVIQCQSDRCKMDAVTLLVHGMLSAKLTAVFSGCCRTSIPSTDLVLTLRNVRLSATTLVFDSGAHVLTRVTRPPVSYTAADFEAMQTASAYAQASAEHASTNSQAASHHDTDAQEESSGFIVTVRTKESSAKIRVTLGTTMGQIAKKLGLEGRRFEFDGEKLDESTTIEEAGMEAMDIVEVR
ncbi:hypothetical protein BC831DRAFT_438070 [Entophlyctis helioformis]|nr:hypothetical protein BC831DRAFT_438070 [Entophlyctis helioformis]